MFILVDGCYIIPCAHMNKNLVLEKEKKVIKTTNLIAYKRSNYFLTYSIRSHSKKHPENLAYFSYVCFYINMRYFKMNLYDSFCYNPIFCSENHSIIKKSVRDAIFFTYWQGVLYFPLGPLPPPVSTASELRIRVDINRIRIRSPRKKQNLIPTPRK